MASPSMLRNGEPFMETIPKREDPATSVSHLVYSHYPDMFTYQNNCHDSLVYVMPSDSGEALNGETMTKNTGSRWREDETEALVEIWRDKICQTRWWKQSKGVRVNKEMWEEISQLLAEREVYRTASQCQIRMKNLLQFYRQAVDSRRSEKSWEDLPEYFDIVDRIMTRREGNSNNGEDEKPPLRVAATTELPEEEVNETNDVNVETDTANMNAAATVTTADTKPADEVIDAVSPSKKRAKFEADVNIKTEDKRKYPAVVSTCRAGTVENGFNPPRYSAAVRGHAPVVSTVMPAYYPRDQTRWRPAQNICCDTSGSKRFCFGNEKDTVRHLPEYPMNHSTYGASKTYIHPANQYAGAGADPKPASANHVCSPTETCHVQGCAHRTAPKRTLYSVNSLPSLEGEERVPPNSLHYIQELMHLQFKQMEKFIDIEKQRLDIEKQRLREEQESSNRNTAFLMEAVRILAESFRKNEPKTFPADK